MQSAAALILALDQLPPEERRQVERHVAAELRARLDRFERCWRVEKPAQARSRRRNERIAQLIAAGLPARTLADWRVIRRRLIAEDYRLALVAGQPIPDDLMSPDWFSDDRYTSARGMRKTYLAWLDRQHPAAAAA